MFQTRTERKKKKLKKKTLITQKQNNLIEEIESKPRRPRKGKRKETEIPKGQ